MPTLTFTDISLLRPTPFLFPCPLKPTEKLRIHRLPLKLRCSIAEESKISPSKLSPNLNAADAATADCVIIGGGISGLCIAQALATNHSAVAPNVIVTEARDRVGGNIITVERDGYLWEEGPNSFQPSDPMLKMVVRFRPILSFYHSCNY